MSLQIEELLTLQALDNSLTKLQREMEALDKGERVERALQQRRLRQENAARRLSTLQADQRAAELELRSLEERRHQTSHKLYDGRITNPRELQTLEMEVAALERQRQRLDEQILKRMDDIEAARKSLETHDAAVAEAEKAYRVLCRRYERDSKRINDAIAEQQPERARLAARLAPDTLKRYEDIRKRQHNIGAVRIENGACGGCRMKIGAALHRRLLPGDQYVFCESCNRYLFQELE